MKSASLKKTKRVKLQVDTEINFKLIGISSHENDYRLVWAINNQLQMRFVRTENLVIHDNKLGAEMGFSCFVYYDEDRFHTYKLISNRCPDGFLFQEIRNFDFIIQVTKEMTDTELKVLIRKLKAVEVISASFLLDPEKLKGLRDILPE